MHEYVCVAGNLQYPNSDHYGTFTIHKNFCTQSINSKKTVLLRNIKAINHDSLNSGFNNINWENLVYNEQNLDLASNNTISSLETLLDTHAPLYKLPSRKIKYYNKPWIDKELLTLISKKNKLFNIKSSIPTEINKTKFKKFNNMVTTLRRKKKREYFRNYFLNIKRIPVKCGLALIKHWNRLNL